MFLNTNLGFGFRSFKDLLVFMKENNINDVNVVLESDNFIVSFQKEKMTINDIEKHIEEFGSLCVDITELGKLLKKS